MLWVFLYIILAKRQSAPNCQTVADVGFILDSSGSLRKDYTKEKNFLKAVATKFGVSSMGTRIGVLTFSYFSELSIKLSDHSDISSFNQAVDNIPLMGSTTRIDRALRLAQKEMFSFANGGRAGVPKLLILLTDGSQTQDAFAEEPRYVAGALRANGINIVVVGIGNAVNKTELKEIAGNWDSVYLPDNFDKLIRDFVSPVVNKSCEAGNDGIACE